MNTQFDNLKKSSVEIIEEQNRLEASLNLSDSHFEKVLSLSGDVCANYCEVSGGEIRYGGRITFNVVYEGDGIERLEAGAEFSYKKIGDYNEGVGFAELSLGGLKLKKSGGMLYAEAIINANITYEKQENVEYLCDVDAFKKLEDAFVGEVVSVNKSFELDDEFECQKLKKALYSKAWAYITKVQSGNNVVICDGEVVLSCALLLFGQNSDIVKEKRTIPFRLEIDADGVREDMPCSAVVDVSKVNLKVYVDEEAPQSTISASVEIKLNAKVQNYVDLQVVADAYSCENDLKLVKNAMKFDCLSGFEAFEEKVNGKCECQVPENSRFVTMVGENVEFLGKSYDEGKINVDATIYGDAIFVDGEGQTVSKRAEFPFSISVSPKCDFISDLALKLQNVNTKLRSGQIEIESNVRLSYSKYVKNEINVISQIEEGDKKAANNAAISVYLGKKGDTEWDITKELGVGIDEIFELNPELEFPLNGGESIVCFRKEN